MISILCRFLNFLISYYFSLSVFACLVMSNSLQFMDCSPPGSSVHGTSQEEYWSGLPFPSPGDLLHWQADSLHIEPSGPIFYLHEPTPFSSTSLTRVVLSALSAFHLGFPIYEFRLE